jgi:steroid 5-alpha reductase family enzyme
LAAVPALKNWLFFTLVSPVFIALLIIFVSGLPMLEKYADQKWGESQAYRDYKRSTSVLVIWPWSCACLEGEDYNNI